MAVIKTQISLRLEPETLAKLKKIANEYVRSSSNMIEYLIMQKIKDYEYENGEIELTDEDIYPM